MGCIFICFPNLFTPRSLWSLPHYQTRTHIDDADTLIPSDSKLWSRSVLGHSQRNRDPQAQEPGRKLVTEEGSEPDKTSVGLFDVLGPLRLGPSSPSFSLLPMTPLPYPEGTGGRKGHCMGFGLDLFNSV